MLARNLHTDSDLEAGLCRTDTSTSPTTRESQIPSQCRAAGPLLIGVDCRMAEGGATARLRCVERDSECDTEAAPGASSHDASRPPSLLRHPAGPVPLALPGPFGTNRVT